MEILTVAFFTAFLSSAVRMAIPLVYGGLGEVFLQRSGVLNIGIEGVMLSGAFCAYIGIFYWNSPWIGLGLGILGGLLVALLHGFITVHLHQNQSVSGIALNILVLGLTSYFYKIMTTGSSYVQSNTFSTIEIPVLSKIPILGQGLFNQDWLTYCAYGLMIAMVVFYKYSKQGLYFTAVGENARVADTAGLNVTRYRMTAIYVNGILGGIGGAFLVVVQLGAFNDNMIAGRGYIALATVILGRFKPVGVALAALLFGASLALQVRLQAIDVDWPSQVFAMLPYVITLLALVCTAGKSSAPAALTIPFQREER